MLKSHIDQIENVLIEISKIPANSGHPLHKGTPREAFIREFLQNHLPTTVSIGSGEIISADSKPGEPRNQYDIVIYKNNYPKLDFGGGISGFLIESVIATIEVKSNFTKKDLEQAINASINCKKLPKNIINVFSTGYIPPSVLNFVIAYDGPKNMMTIYDWIHEIYSQKGITDENLSLDPNVRTKTPSLSVDGIFVLKKGFLYFDNGPVGFVTDKNRSDNPDCKWVIADISSGNLLLFFLFIQTATANIQGQWLNSVAYLKSFGVTNALFRP
jgi:hypothetical protein